MLFVVDDEFERTVRAGVCVREAKAWVCFVGGGYPTCLITHRCF